jgi:glutamine cyclotransferase
LKFFEGKHKVHKINELEYANGMLYANVFQSSDLLVIDPITGEVQKRYNLKGLLSDEKQYLRDHKLKWSNFDRLNNVLNGVAYHAQTDTFFLSGKNWHYIY